MTRRHIATIAVELVGSSYELTVRMGQRRYECERTDTLVTGAALAVEHILATHAYDTELLRLRNQSAGLEALTESALRDNRIVLGAGDIT